MLMEKLLTGIHHITAIAQNTRENLDFYTGILGLRLVKQTVNFDDPGVYHLYYGNETGMPGSLLTFFPYARWKSGRKGTSMVYTTAFSVPLASRDYWVERLRRFRVAQQPIQERWGKEPFLYFEDRDGLGLELVFTDQDARPVFSYGHIPAAYAIRGIHHATIWEADVAPTIRLLTEHLQHRLIEEHDNRFRLTTDDDRPGHYVDLLHMPGSPKGLPGWGTVHHIAFATPGRKSQDDLRQRLIDSGFQPTSVLDRHYFTSVYFREPGGVLFELATTGPGFMIDETQEELGTSLKWPPVLVSRYPAMHPRLPSLSLHLQAFS